MRSMMKLLITVLTLSIGLLSISVLTATQPYWSDLPSTQNIERYDSLTGFDITKYILTLSVNNQTQYLDGNVKAFVTAESNLSEIKYSLMGGTLAVSLVKVNDNPVTFTHTNGTITIPLSITAGQQFTTQVFYSGNNATSPAPYNIGLKYNANSIYTLSNPDAGRYWWPSYDHPWDKALIDMHITVRSDWTVATIGTRQSITDNGNGTKTHFWSLSSPVATYVVGFVAGPLVEFTQQAGDIPIQNFVLSNQLTAAQVDFANVPEMIDFFSTVYGPYPFEKYGHAVVTISPYAAMEHQTMTTFGAQYINGLQTYEPTVAHELAHQWMGNSVTPLTMREVWLKESFATYSEFLWAAHRFGWASGLSYLASSIQNYYLSWENSNGPHTIYNPQYNEMFAPPTYEKSASVLHMLRLKMGNTAFFNFVRNYYSTYANSNVITAEIKAAAEQSSGLDLTQFFQQWIYSPGIPSANLTFFSDGNSLVKVVAKTTSPTTTQFDIEIPLKLSGSTLLDSVVVRATHSGFSNVIPYNPVIDNLANIQIDPNHWVLNRGYSVNTFQLTQCLPANQSVTLTWTALNCPLTIAGYNIYRKTLPDGAFLQLNSLPVQGLTYTDQTSVNGVTYQYCVTATETAGFESLPSNVLSATPIDFPFDWGFLVVDETRDGSGTTFNPTDQMVDSFYANALLGFSSTNWDYSAMGAPTLNTLSHFPLVLWHGDDYTDFLIDDNISTLSSYIISGGKLLISGWKYQTALPQAFYDQWFDGLVPQILNQPVLISAHSDVYPDLYPDPDKLTPVWNNLLSMSAIFPGAMTVVYSAEVLNSGNGHGEPLAIRSDNNGTVVLLGFPLYYMMQNQVRTFLQQILPQLYPGVSIEDENLPNAPWSFTCYPNPFNGQLKIAFTGKQKSSSVLTIFNIKGQKVRSYSDIKGNELIWDGCDEKQ
ncbi:MAG: glutamyl aminopeptidase, partial [Candidatus Cloacimonetes bacterium]|nr:glutamyl aminopeptidase [Candidatus Cloacimonadota bacterium]